MLAQLTIQNFGLIDRLSIDFREHLNIFTGETGAGKSILIDALRYALGERLNPAQIRNPEKSCIVEAVFELSNDQLKDIPALSERITDDEPSLIVNRTYSSDGRSRNKINGFTVTVSELKELGNLLIDFHGPHDHQMLLSEESHIGILDRLSSLDKEKTDYASKYGAYFDLKKKLNELHALSEHRVSEQDTLKSQLKELEQVPLDADKHEELLSESARIDNIEKLHECGRQLVNMLENEEIGISNIASQAFAPMKTLNDIDNTTEQFMNILEHIQEDTSELASALNGYLDGLSFQESETININKQCDAYNEILRKYGPGLEDARKFYETAKEKYSLLVDLEHNNAELKSKIKTAQKEARDAATKISAKRKKAAKDLEGTIEKELKELGIKHVQFECRIEKIELTKTGNDKVTFYISPNAGESLKPLAEIVSSGEAARIMLALKKALTKVDPIPVLIFDEIDAQIGGRLGTITGRKLKELSRDRQVILITHLPQIASFGDHHFKVSKKVHNAHTVTDVNFLDNDMRIKELAKMMSGETESKIAVQHASDMLAQAKSAL